MDTAATLDQYTQDVSNLPAELQHQLAELGSSDQALYEIRKRISQKDSTIHKFIKQHGALTKNPKESQLYPKIREDYKKAEALQREKCITANTALFLTAKHFLKLEADLEKLHNEGLLAVEDLDIDLSEELFSSRTTTRAGTEAPSSSFGAVPAVVSQTSQPLGGHTIPSAATVVQPAPSMIPEQKKAIRKTGIQKASTPTVAAATRTVKRQRTDETTPGAVDVIEIPQPVKRNTQSPKVELDPNTSKNGDDDQLYCTCQRVSFGEMVGCDNDDCKFEWFHYECVGLKEPPKGKWFCADCQQQLKNKKKRKH
ncbi:CYFA0S10e00606g1_1 [Cyberlindnera fabianii]|uniref:Chromatin modification-related protein n=1 Tax=Cyberlindnera fabianii TaxID=36022 RepID=A0A061AZI9_CYBFA|nr:CYFA0S10e00606g1_1 [Cyberlindnera fabianii]